VLDFKWISNLQKMELSLPGLTRRESEVAALIIRSMLNKQIAAKLGISEQRVKNLRSSVYRKTNTNSSVELLHYYIQSMSDQQKRDPIPALRAIKGDERYERFITLLNEEELIRLQRRAEQKKDWWLVKTIETEIIKHRGK
jgi:DNA-binding CsgD family transcriptional regulator